MISPLFGTDGIRGAVNQYPVDPITIVKIGIAIGNVGKIVLLGKDTRISGYMLESALTSGLISVGADVVLLGPIPTPAIPFLIKSTKADIGIMISASHNPHYDNGLKIFNKGGFKIQPVEEALIESLLVENLNDKFTMIDNLGKARRLDDAKRRYVNFIKSTSGCDLSGKKIVIDCANGAAYQIAPTVFRELNASVMVLNNKPNGLNINNGCGSLYPQSMVDAVINYGADIGISLDGDADRVILCDESGRIIDGENTIASIVKAKLLDNSLKNKKIASNIMASLSLEHYLKSCGVELFRSEVGDQRVIDCMHKNKCDFGGEPSGHIIFPEYNTTSDGIVTALKIISLMCSQNKRASEICNVFKAKPKVMKNIDNHRSIDLHNQDLRDYITSVEKKISGRILVRKSGTEQLIRILAEGQEIERVERAVDDIVEALYQGLSG